MIEKKHPFGIAAEAIVYPILLLMVMWVVFLAELTTDLPIISLGVKPHAWSQWYGLIFMPLIHDNTDFGHILNNSFPVFVLLAALIYYYREVALQVFSLVWFMSGLTIWLFAAPTGGYHIGMSGVIYGLFGFLFISGFFRNYRPLQVISLGVALFYGSMIWGIFPQETKVSWEGHFAGFLTGCVLAIIYRKLGPVRPKYTYEIEKELGIEPPDFEGMWNEQQALALEKQLAELAQKQQQALHIVYHYKGQADTMPRVIPPDENES
jgi:membrane associated rhomboid family serine protease